jgi:diacylglycerol O-acyltransferase
MDRLNPLDVEFLHLEDGVGHLHIGGISVFAGPPPSLDDFAALLAGKLHAIPRYRQRVRSVPLGLGRPVWVDDPHFDLGYHVHHVALPAPADDAALCRFVSRVMSYELDRNRPLWESWLIEGLPDEQWALLSKVHHAMVDGVSGVDLLTAILDVDPGTLPGPAEPWTPEPEPSNAALVLDAWKGFGEDALRLARAAPAAVVRDPGNAARTVGRTAQGLAAFTRHLTVTPELSIEGSIGPNRAWAHSSASLDDVKRIRKAFGGTVNDVVLAAVTEGYRRLLLSRGEDVDHAVVRSGVPVSLRGEDEHNQFDNRVSSLLYELPVDITDPVERLHSVREQMSELKASPMAEAGGRVITLGTLAPPMVIGAVSRLAVEVMHRLPQRSVNTVTTNVPGPQFPLYCLGREMLAHLPYVPISHGVRVTTGILSYNGKLFFGVTGDLDTAPDVAVLADGIVTGVDDLLTAAESKT